MPERDDSTYYQTHVPQLRANGTRTTKIEESESKVWDGTTVI